MKIEQAYSIDSNEILNVEDAYDFYWAGIIKDKTNFECPSLNCEASITCANIDKLRQDMKVDPYFKATSEHSSECTLVKEIKNKKHKIESIEGNQKPRNKKDEKLADIFIFSRPKSHIEKKEMTSTENIPISSIEKRKVKTSRSNTVNSQPSYFYTVRSFVSKYNTYKKQNLIDKRFINIKNNQISYSEMFIEISNQNITSLSKYPRIYFGKVFINKLKNQDYSANFTSTFILEDNKFIENIKELTWSEDKLMLTFEDYNYQLQKLTKKFNYIRPKIYLSQDMIDNSFTKNLIRNKIEDLSTKNYPEVWAFVYAVPKVKIVNKVQYVNLNIYSLDYIDFRSEI